MTTPNVSQGEIDHVYPQILPGGQAVLFTITAERIEESLIAVLSLDTLEHTVLLRGGSYPRYSPTGHVLYGMEGTLFAVGFDRDRLETLGSPVSVQQGLLTKGQGAANFDLSASGSLIYTPGVVQPVGRTKDWYGLIAKVRKRRSVSRLPCTLLRGFLRTDDTSPLR